MDYLETFDLDSTKKKFQRVQSWYLYEQYKTLEKNQLDAARVLKSKSNQNNILRQELKERRARRKFCENRLKLNNSIQSCTSMSIDDLFEGLCEPHNECEMDELKGSCSDGSQTSKSYTNEVENKIEDFSDSESILSVIDKVIIKENLTNDLKEELEIVKKNIAKNINLQLETVKENIECSEIITKQKEECFRTNSDIDEDDIKKNKTQNIFGSFFSIWSNLVLFAANSIQLNPGNCYSQFSSQLFTALLACDFLCRSVDGICHILQSYVSPIECASVSESAITSPDTRNCRCKRKKTDNYKKLMQTYKTAGSKHCSCNRLRYKLKSSKRRCCSENICNSNYLSDNRINEQICRGASEPWQDTGKYESKNGRKHCRKSHYNLRKCSNKNHCNCNYLKDIVNPILKVSRYIENLLQDVEETWL